MNNIISNDFKLNKFKINSINSDFRSLVAFQVVFGNFCFIFFKVKKKN